MAWLTMPEIAEQLRELADTVESGAGKGLVVSYVDEAGGVHLIRAFEPGEEWRTREALEDVLDEMEGRPMRAMRPVVGEFLDP